MPAARTYPWKRFWAPLEESPLTPEGFLLDPEARFGRIESPIARSLADVATEPCLVLVGSPGAGKSYSVNEEVRRLRRTMTAACVTRLDLAAIGSEQQLFRDLFDSAWFTEWRQGSQSLHLFLDTYDECRLGFPALSKVLVEQLAKCPLERLLLRTVCRAADWPPGLERKLGALWGQEGATVLGLLPLRRDDVMLAAQTEGLDATSFMEGVLSHRAAALAAQPITLKLLLETYLAHGSLPSSAAELFENGCLRLCEELNDDRLESGHTGALTGAQRLQIASRVAALQVLCSRYCLWVGAAGAETTGEDLLPDDVVGGYEAVEGLEFAADRNAIKETMATALFSARGADRLGFSHRTFAEFLAARFLTSRDFSPEQVLSLVAEQSEGRLTVVPQLAGTVAWLAGASPPVRRELLHHAPEIVLRGDVGTLDDKEREAAAAALLGAFDEERLLDVGLGMHRDYAKLGHPGLADQLLPFIQGKSKGPVVRRVAIDIAEACELRQLQGQLVEVFLDASDRIESRIQAGWAISRIADPETRSRARPLLAVEPSDDPEDELKGCALLALWPGLITAHELFASLSRPQRPRFFGAYWHFLSKLPATLAAAHIPPALEFLDTVGPFDFPDPLDDLADGIIKRAVELVSEGVVFEALVEHLGKAVQRSDFAWGYRQREKLVGLLANKPDLRPRLTRALLQRLVPHGDRWNMAVHCIAAPLGPGDVPWLLAQLEAVGDQTQQRALARIISHHFSSLDLDTRDVVVAATRTMAVLADELRWAIGPVDLDSELAESMRQEHHRRQQFELQRAARTEPGPPAEVRITELLATFDDQCPGTWLPLDSELLRTTGDPQVVDDLVSDPTRGWAWPQLSEETQRRVTQAASSFLRRGDPAPGQWLGKTLGVRPAFAGYRALRLLDLMGPLGLASLPAEVWSRWACIIVGFPISSGNEEWEAPHRKLVRAAYQQAPGQTIRALMAIIDREATEGSGDLFILRKFDFWDECLKHALLEKARQPDLAAAALRCLLTTLLEHKAPEAVDWAGDLLDSLAQTTGPGRERAIAAAEALATGWPEIGWDRAWQAISADRPFGRDVVERMFYRSTREEAITARLTEAQLGRLYVFLEEEHPGAAFEARAEVFSRVGPDDSARIAKLAVLNELKSRGTPAAVDAIRAIRQAFPGIDWLKWVELDAEQARVATVWRPPQPSEVLALARSRANRFVDNVHHLLEVVKESLARLQEDLHAETPSVQFLWEYSSGAPRPKNEPALSDYVKLHLDRDLQARGVIVNREVEIRAPRTVQRGEEVDIHVDAVRRLPGGAFDRLKVIIEVKGCWHSELRSAMETQLVGRYLADNQGAGGLYLVGWFNCRQWDEGDSRRGEAGEFEIIGSARAYFGEQAAKLSNASHQVMAVVLDVSLR